MKKLILIRHGEAEPETTGKSDFDRDLTERGKKDAAKMAALLLNKVSPPEIIVCSPAFRAINTAHIFAATFGFDDVNTDAAIYEASAETLLKIVNQLSDDQMVACLVGHNPGVSNLLYILTGEITTMPTSAWVEVELDAETWAAVSADTGQMLQYQYP
ncbi:MAG: histidine phosphatase family protein [Sphingobacteriaceae bacterium]|nr:MAG: histidine phosphatase family protein [Sphingobacteriaceae bacterium]